MNRLTVGQKDVLFCFFLIILSAERTVRSLNFNKSEVAEEKFLFRIPEVFKNVY